MCDKIIEAKPENNVLSANTFRFINLTILSTLKCLLVLYRRSNRLDKIKSSDQRMERIMLLWLKSQIGVMFGF